jgi:pyruvate dehydrogenase E2 component (dihydrolipoamide acetyltransferase)
MSAFARLVAEQAGETFEGRAGTGPGGQVMARDLCAPRDRAARGESAPAGRPASLLAREIARQAAVALPRAAGSGHDGRVLARDLLPPPGESLPAAPPADVTAPAPPGTLPEHTLQPIGTMRRIIAGRLGASKREAPHYYMSVRCRAAALADFRATLNADRPDGERISLNDILVKIAATALARVPALNAAWTEAGVARFHAIDVSVAVATSRGLVTPVVREAAAKGIGEIAAAMRALVERARDGSLQRAEYEGGTFTVSNLGMFGVSEFAAIINPPQAAILALAAAERTPVAVGDEVRIEPVMTCTLSVDHRVADGEAGARYLTTLKALIEEPRRLLL